MQAYRGWLPGNSSPVRNICKKGESALMAERTARVTVREISQDLGISSLRVRVLLRDSVIPNVRLGRDFLVTREAYEQWKRTCGVMK